jgi:hypothetical protein
MSQTSATSLFRQLIREAKLFDNYNFRFGSN